MQTVLVLEDDVAILALIRLIVEQEGYNVLLANSKQEAFERFEENDAYLDLLIADITLPVSSGISVAQELHSLLPNLRMIIMSGFPSTMWTNQDAAELEELPSDSVITLQKPFAPATLLDSIYRLIGLPLVAAPGLKVKTAGQ